MERKVQNISITLDASEKRKLIDWLQGPILAGTNSWTLHSSAKSLYEKGTGDWVFQTPEWNNWINFRERAVWMHGIPGAGKTVLASYLIEKIIGLCKGKGKQPCIYYYCYHGHNQDESGPFLRMFVSELLRKVKQVPRLAWEAYERRAPPDQHLLLDMLEITLSSFNRVFVGLDALDESQPRENLLALLETLTTQDRFSKIQLFATSREYEDIKLKMDCISQSLSMTNPYVEADIRQYVAARIQDNAKFQRWPEELRYEVENTLSTNAKGMFRWTVCQLDILRRLHHQSKIKEAIRSLPETLDETYERIFSYIAEQQRDLARHALHWVCFHDFLWKGSALLPARVLVDSYFLTQDAQEGYISHDLIFDVETLKDVCGCLLCFQPLMSPRGEETVTIAHYTVREFLESIRASTEHTSWTKIRTETCYSTILSQMFDRVMTPHPPLFSEFSTETSFSSMESIVNIRDYCAASSIRALATCEKLVQSTSAFRLLDPSEAHYDELSEAIRMLDLDAKDDLGLGHMIVPFWQLEWTEGSKNSMAAVLINLFVMDCHNLAESFMRKANPVLLMQKQLEAKIIDTELVFEDLFGIEYLRECKIVQGSLVDMLVQLRHFHRKVFELIQDIIPNVVDYKSLLPSCMACREYNTETYVYGPEDDVLQLLLDIGSDPDPKGFKVSPLQLAIHLRNLKDVRILLEAGANPNHSGDPQGVEWDRSLVLGAHNHLHGVAPIDILHKFQPLIVDETITMKKDREKLFGRVTGEIERVLLSFGAAPTKYPHMMNGEMVQQVC